ncbi:MAG: DEAD/DEAH box helicase [Segniliparus sp.]|uniref:DEAD/DEAH box helicase n=1 Tax=Segniliparus sp. TaxID=2804064 RepID=UPI003F391636
MTAESRERPSSQAEAPDYFAEFQAGLRFKLDPFQVRACRAVQEGRGALVCAPTGAGKTVVGEFAAALAVAKGGKCFYTTPIKALSNQKHADFAALLGADQVGLLTGDVSVNSEAPVVVMTTEVLRNMIYAHSPTLAGLSHVVMDEVHYLADRFRGAVWEEVILNLPREVVVVSLSATVGNAEEFGEWLQEVRGDTEVVVEERRPVPLSQHVLVGERMFDLEPEDPRHGERSADGELSKAERRLRHELEAHIKQQEALASFDDPRPVRHRGGQPPRRRGGHGQTFLSRARVIGKLEEERLLPAIWFIFSRAGCDDAVAHCLRSPLRLISPEQSAEVRALIEERTAQLDSADLRVLGYETWKSALERGIAAHHAGMFTLWRHIVEELFVKGMVKVVFATETLALGVNMPARSVVLESLVKFNGESHVDLTPGEYTQLTGRAGRRGIDTRGHAVLRWKPGVRAASMLRLTDSRTYPLRSSFRPSYNMSVNLIDRVGPAASRSLLAQSFAQFQTDRSVSSAAVVLARREQELEKETKRLDIAASPLSSADVLDYLARKSDLSSGASRTQQRKGRSGSVGDGIRSLRRGDVVRVPVGRRQGWAVVLSPDHDGAHPRPLVLTEAGWSGKISAVDFANEAPQLVGTMSVPKHLDPRDGRTKRDTAARLTAYTESLPAPLPKRERAAASDGPRSLREHPVHRISQREEVLAIARRQRTLTTQVERLREEIGGRSGSLARMFDQITALLADFGYLAPDPDSDEGPTTTDLGRMLRRTYSESDLLICECLRWRIWEELSPAELAAVASCVLYEPRGDDERVSRMPTRAAQTALAETLRLWSEVGSAEQARNLPTTREPNAGLAHAMWAWADGANLGDALDSHRGLALSPGDFIRWCRQVVDLLGQIEALAPSAELAERARAAINGVRRGVVALEA